MIIGQLTESVFASQFREDIQDSTFYCPAFDRWYRKSGHCWEADPDHVDRLLTKALDDLRDKAPDNPEVQREIDHLYERQVRERVIGRLRTNEQISIDPVECDRDPMLLGCCGRVLDLRTGQLLEEIDEYEIVTRSAGVSWNPKAKCPTWLAFLDRIFSGDQELIAYVQRAVGYTLTGHVGEQVMFLLFGTGANGKTTFLNALRYALWTYSRSADISLLTASARERHAVDNADLFRTRMAVLSEIPAGQRLSEAKVKALTGSDLVLVRKTQDESWDFAPTHKLWVSMNQLPEIRGTDHAIWRRLQPIPFEVQIPPAERDPLLPDKLKAESQGILKWAVDGCLEWQRQRLNPPERIRAVAEEYRSQQDGVARFIADRCVKGPGEVAASKELYDAYVRWSDEGGEVVVPAITFGKRLASLGFEAWKATGGARKWKGICLITEKNDSEPPSQVA